MRHRTLASARVFLIAAAALVLIESAAPRAQTQGDGGLTVTYSASDTSIVATWTTATSADTKCFAGEKPGLDNNAPEPNKTSHVCIVTGLSPNTSYLCYVTSGGGNSNRQSVTTNVAQTRIPINQVALGSTVVTGTQVGDDLATFVSDDSNQYIVQDDGYGFTHTANAGANMQIGILNNLSTLVGSNVNLLAAYGRFGTFNGTDGPGGIPQTNKLGGIFGFGGSLYAFQHRASGLNDGINVLYGNFIKSNDHGATWNSWQATGTFSANGVPPSPLRSYMYANGNIGVVLPVRYAADDGTIGYLTSGNRIDGADGWVYLAYKLTNDSTYEYMMRVPRIQMEYQTRNAFEYWTCTVSCSPVTPASFVNDSNWASTPASATPIFYNGANGNDYTGEVDFIPGLNYYLFSQSVGGGNAVVWQFWSGPTPAGPWTLLAQQADLVHGWYIPLIAHSSIVGNTAASAIALTLLYSGSSAGRFYGVHDSTATLNPTASPNMQQLAYYGCSIVENPVSDHGSISTANGYGNVEGISGNACTPAASSTPGLAVYTAPPVAGDTGAPWPDDQYAEIVSPSANGLYGASVRMNATAGTGYSGVVYPRSNAALIVSWTGGGSLTTLVNCPPNTSIGADDIWRLTDVGTRLTLYQNGVATTCAVSDSAHASGSPGWYEYGNAGASPTIGLFDAGGNQASSPTFSTYAPAYSGSVTITSATSGARIYYTTDGTQPTRNSSFMANGGAVSVTSPATVKAIAAYTNLADSPVSTVSY